MGKFVAIIKFLTLLFSAWIEKDKAKKQRKKEALKMVREGLSEDDPSKITAGFDRARR